LQHHHQQTLNDRQQRLKSINFEHSETYLQQKKRLKSIHFKHSETYLQQRKHMIKIKNCKLPETKMIFKS
jgi:hypothetical protein